MVNIAGFASNFFNGRFLLKAVDEVDDIITVSPYRGRVNNLPSVTSTTTSGKLTAWTDHVYKVDTLGAVVYNLSGFFEPEYICTDKNQNLWVAHDINTVTQITTAGEIATSIKVFDISNTNIFCSAGATYGYATSADTLHLGGITFDTNDNMYVINAFEGRLYKIPVVTPTLSSSYVISDTVVAPNTTHVFPRGRHMARGDWNGFRAMNKFDNTVTFILQAAGIKFEK